MTCKKCGFHVNDGAKFCGKCGCSLTAVPRIRMSMPEKAPAAPEKAGTAAPAKKADKKTAAPVKKADKKAAAPAKKAPTMTMAARATRNDKPTMASMAVLEEQKRRAFLAAPLKEKRRMLETAFHALVEEYRPELCRRKSPAAA